MKFGRAPTTWRICIILCFTHSGAFRSLSVLGQAIRQEQFGYFHRRKKQAELLESVGFEQVQAVLHSPLHERLTHPLKGKGTAVTKVDLF